jgi:hypothetical protein
MDIQRDSRNAIERGSRYIMDNNLKGSEPQEELTGKMEVPTEIYSI